MKGTRRGQLSESEGKGKANSNPILALCVYYSHLFVLVTIYSEKERKTDQMGMARSGQSNSYPSGEDGEFAMKGDRQYSELQYNGGS